MGPKDADGMANGVAPDQTAPVGAVWSASKQSDLGLHCLPKTCLSENLGSLRYLKIQNNLGFWFWAT